MSKQRVSKTLSKFDKFVDRTRIINAHLSIVTLDPESCQRQRRRVQHGWNFKIRGLTLKRLMENGGIFMVKRNRDGRGAVENRAANDTAVKFRRVAAAPTDRKRFECDLNFEYTCESAYVNRARRCMQSLIRSHRSYPVCAQSSHLYNVSHSTTEMLRNLYYRGAVQYSGKKPGSVKTTKQFLLLSDSVIRLFVREKKANERFCS